MAKTYDVITVGGVTEDLFFTVDDYVMIDNRQDILRKKLLAFEYGAKIGVRDTDTAYGGGAANTAVAFSRLGLKAGIIATVGSDTRGEGILLNFKKNKVDARLVQKNRQLGSGLSFILVSPRRDHIVFTYRGANGKVALGTKEKTVLKNSAWTYLTSLSGAWHPILKAVFASAQKIAWNPGREQLAAGFKSLRPYLQQTDVLILNKDEAIELVMSHPNVGHDNARSLDDLKYLLSVLHGFGAGIVIITNGSHGASAYDGTDHYFQKVVRAKQVADTTGVGDAFGASFVAGLKLYSGNIKKSLLLAAKNSASVVACQGAQEGLIKK